MNDRDLSLSQFSAKDRELLAAVFEHETVNLFIHLDDCEDDACTGCDPQHLAEKAVETDADDYRFCGADLGRTEFPFTCYRRIAHEGPCGPDMDLAGGAR
jgi:hypothetical protein